MAAFILVLLILLFINSTFSGVNEKNELFYLVASSKSLQIGHSINISVKPSFRDASKLTYGWNADAGLIEGTGSQIKYVAPQSQGTATINLMVRDQDGNAYNKSISFLVYKQFIILKADDFIYYDKGIIPTRWKTFINYTESKHIKASIGIIGNSLEMGDERYFSLIKAINSRGNFEFWNHGYDHQTEGINENGESYAEFRNTPYEYQKEHLLKTQDLAREKLNITFQTFAVPGNAFDNTTARVLEDVKDIKIWFFGDSNSSKLVLKRDYNLESYSQVPDNQQFFKRYKPNIQYIILQLHPDTWDEQQFEQFKQAIDFLIKQNVTFVTPSEYRSLTENNMVSWSS